MSKKIFVKLINDERTDRNIVSGKACDNTSTDICTKLDYASCTVHSYDICEKDHAGCYKYSYDYCDKDTAACEDNTYDYN